MPERSRSTNCCECFAPFPPPGKPIVHVIDREADSVGHWRTWDAADHKLLIRGDDRIVRCEDHHVKLSDIRRRLRPRGVFHDAGAALYHGRKARLRAAETTVVLDRPARTLIGKKQVAVPRPLLVMRSILTRVEDEQGKRWPTGCC